MKFAVVAEYFEQLERTSKRKELVSILAGLFSKASAEEAGQLAYLCQGRVAPFFEPVELGMGEKLVAEAIGRAAELSRDAVLERYGQVGDLGLVAREVIAGRASEIELGEVFARLRRIADTTGAGSVEGRVSQLSDLFNSVDSLSAKHVTRVPLGRLRLGIGDPSVLDALSTATAGDTSLRKRLERAYNETSDLGMITRVLFEDGIEAVDRITVEVGKPVRPALAERLPSAQAVIEKLGECASEYKLDGFRCQVHLRDGVVHIFSRNLEDMSGMFPEIVEAVASDLSCREVIAEGEAVAYHRESEEFYPFQQTSRRRRKYGVDEFAQKLPLRLFLFDLMWLDGEPQMDRSFQERRKLLEGIVGDSEVLALTPKIVTDNPEELQMFLDETVQKGLEGLVAKRLDSPYKAGGRNFNWVKLKRVASSHMQDTVDCVIVGYIYGRGKRAAFGVGALLVGVYDDETDEFATISKIGTGLSDEQWREVRKKCDNITLQERPARVSSILEPSVWVEPKVVVEVLADEITRSQVHTAGRQDDSPGYALRFPRLISFRGDDKRSEDATTVREVREMFDAQYSGQQSAMAGGKL
jgi:DNA ligase-1